MITQTAYKDFYEGVVGLKEVLDVLETTDATTTTISTITLEDDCFGYTIVKVFASQTGVTLLGMKVIHWRTSAGVAYILSTTTLISDSKYGLTTATWTVDASGVSLRVRVTGEVGTTINWYSAYDNNFETVTPP